MTAQCLISFGSNLGSRDSVIADAARKVQSDAHVMDFRASRLFETPSIGGPGGQDPFLNAVAAFETDAAATEVLAMLQHIENELGRQRRQRWDARTIDLDVVLHGQLVRGSSHLVVPHPRYTARQFVLQPACDVAPHFRDPRFGCTLDRLASHVTAGTPSMALVGGDESTRIELCRRLSEDLNIQTFASAPMPEPMAVVGNVPLATAANYSQRSTGQPIKPRGDQPWVAAYLPELPGFDSDQANAATVPRLVGRLHWATPETSWPAPHQMWPAGWRWPEYRLEIDDIEWAANEIASALTSMRCSCAPVTENGQWWQ